MHFVVRNVVREAPQELMNLLLGWGSEVCAPGATTVRCVTKRQGLPQHARTFVPYGVCVVCLASVTLLPRPCSSRPPAGR